MTIGEKIRFLRKQKHLTQQDIAEKIGVGREAVYKYEKGIVTNLPLNQIEKLADALGTTTHYLIGEEDSPEKRNKAEALFNQYDQLSPDEQRAVDNMIRLFIEKK